MEDFLIYLKLGYEHITDLNGYDHILFVLALCAIYRASDWKKVLILVTAFTVGHSITLALASSKVIQYSTAFVEFLIPLTIVITCISNLLHRCSDSVLVKEYYSPARYFFAAGFGLIHGMGFSNYLRSLLGKSENIVVELLAFNIGLEFGQLLIVAFGLALSFMVLDALLMKKQIWNYIISSFIAGMAFKMMLDKWEELPLNEVNFQL